jgi:hypothetical protein
MRTRPVTATILLLAGLAAACSAAGPGNTSSSGEGAGAGPRSQPPVVHVAGRDLTSPPLGAGTVVADGAGGGRAAPTELADVDDPADIDVPVSDDPAAASAALLTELLATEGLSVTSIDTHLESDDGGRARVRVDVAHSPGHGHPVQSVYLLELFRDAGRWRLVGSSELG